MYGNVFLSRWHSESHTKVPGQSYDAHFISHNSPHSWSKSALTLSCDVGSES